MDAVLGQVDGHHAHFVIGSNGRELYSFETDHRELEHFPIGVALLAGHARRARIPGVPLALFTDVAVHVEAGWPDLIPERPVGVVTVEDALAAPGSAALHLGAFHPTGVRSAFSPMPGRSLPTGSRFTSRASTASTSESPGSTSWQL